MSDTWTIQSTLNWIEDYLGRKGDENPRLSAQWLLSDVTGLPRIELYVHFDRPLSMEERDVLRDYVARRGAGEPLQYITGEVGFRHISVKVREGVLIPRPETEVLVSEVLSLLPSSKVMLEYVEGLEAKTAEEEPKAEPEEELLEETSHLSTPSLVADLCTGSGCIACSIAYENPQTQVIATDIEKTAVSLAQENVDALGLSDRVQIFHCDLADAIPDEYLGSFDVVASNPPYIPTGVLEDLPREVSDFEPELALDGGQDGLDVFRPLTIWARDALKPGGSLVLELHESCLDEAAAQAEQQGFSQTRIVNDLADRPRVLIATR